MAIIKFKKIEKRIFQFRIDIKGAKPPIWRRVQVRDDMTFEELHIVIQICFNWFNYHMHQFVINSNTFIVDMENEFYEPNFFGHKEYDEKSILLKECFKKENDKIIYEYDFGDDWEHIIKLEKILEKKEGEHYPSITGGKRVAPFEDSGGVQGWKELCEIMEGNKKEYSEKYIEEMLEIYGEFNPNDFDKEDIQLINEEFEEWEN